MQKLIFFRNDDVRGELDDSLVKITEICIKNQVPICHAVEPANLGHDVINWLLDLKNRYSNLIEIVQHGYNHALNFEIYSFGKKYKGEFGYKQTYQEQYEKIKSGYILMEKYFGDKWFKCFTFPYGGRNEDSIKALVDLGYQVINGSLGISLSQRLFYHLGHFLKRTTMLNKKVSWNLMYRNNSNLFQIDNAISIITKYYDSNCKAELITADELIKKINKYAKKLDNIGLLLHHRYHTDDQSINIIQDYINLIKKNENYSFVTQEMIYRVFK